jgi:hypothetical protein
MEDLPSLFAVKKSFGCVYAQSSKFACSLKELWLCLRTLSVIDDHGRKHKKSYIVGHGVLRAGLLSPI